MISNGIFEYWQSKALTLARQNEFHKTKNLKSVKKKKIDQTDSSSNKNDDPINSLTNFQLQSAYYFFFIGVCISILSILNEIISFFIT